MRYDLEHSRDKMDAVFDLCKEANVDYYADWQIKRLEEDTLAVIYDLLVAQYAQGLSDGIGSIARDCYSRPI